MHVQFRSLDVASAVDFTENFIFNSMVSVLHISIFANLNYLLEYHINIGSGKNYLLEIKLSKLIQTKKCVKTILY